MPDDLVMIIEEYVEEIMELMTEKLPADWRAYPHPNSTKDIGNSILNETDVQVFAVPSAVVPREYNYVLNPANMLQGEAVVVDAEPITLDGRIKQ
jgi:RES domain-containing protein